MNIVLILLGVIGVAIIFLVLLSLLILLEDDDFIRAQNKAEARKRLLEKRLEQVSRR